MASRGIQARSLFDVSTSLLYQFEVYTDTKEPEEPEEPEEAEAAASYVDSAYPPRGEDVLKKKPWFHYHNFEEERASLLTGDALDPSQVGEWVDQVVAYDSKPWYEKFIGLFTGESQEIAKKRRVLVASQVHEVVRARRRISNAGAGHLDDAGNYYYRHLSRAIDAPVTTAAGEAPSVPTFEDGFSRPGWKLGEQVSRLGFFDRLGWLAQSFLTLVTGSVVIEGVAVQKAMLVKEGTVSMHLQEICRSEESASELADEDTHVHQLHQEGFLGREDVKVTVEGARAVAAKKSVIKVKKRKVRTNTADLYVLNKARDALAEAVQEELRNMGASDRAAAEAVEAMSATSTPARDSLWGSHVRRGMPESKDADELYEAALDS